MIKKYNNLKTFLHYKLQTQTICTWDLKKKLKLHSIIIIYLKTKCKDNKIKFKPVKTENNKGLQYYNIESVIFISFGIPLY